MSLNACLAEDARKIGKDGSAELRLRPGSAKQPGSAVSGSRSMEECFLFL